MGDPMTINRGIRLHEAKRIAPELGIEVRNVHRTGEVRFTFPGLKPVTQNNRRLDACRALVVLLRRVARRG